MRACASSCKSRAPPVLLQQVQCLRPWRCNLSPPKAETGCVSFCLSLCPASVSAARAGNWVRRCWACLGLPTWTRKHAHLAPAARPQVQRAYEQLHERRDALLGADPALQLSANGAAAPDGGPRGQALRRSCSSFKCAAPALLLSLRAHKRCFKAPPALPERPNAQAGLSSAASLETLT